MQSRKERRREASRQAAKSLLEELVSGETEVYVAYRRLYGIWCGNNAAVQELRPLFRIPGIEPDARLSITPELESQVRSLAAAILPSREG